VRRRRRHRRRHRRAADAADSSLASGDGSSLTDKVSEELALFLQSVDMLAFEDVLCKQGVW
jgi:hypothetical protein